MHLGGVHDRAELFLVAPIGEEHLPRQLDRRVDRRVAAVDLEAERQAAQVPAHSTGGLLDARERRLGPDADTFAVVVNLAGDDVELLHAARERQPREPRGAFDVERFVRVGGAVGERVRVASAGLANRAHPFGEESGAREAERDATVARVPADDVACERAHHADAQAGGVSRVGDETLRGAAVDGDRAEDARINRRDPRTDEARAVDGARGALEPLRRRGELGARPAEREPGARREVARDADERAGANRGGHPAWERARARSEEADGEVGRRKARERRRRGREELEDRFAPDRRREAHDVPVDVGERGRDGAVAERLGDGERIGAIERGKSRGRRGEARQEELDAGGRERESDVRREGGEAGSHAGRASSHEFRAPPTLAGEHIGLTLRAPPHGRNTICPPLIPLPLLGASVTPAF